MLISNRISLQREILNSIEKVTYVYLIITVSSILFILRDGDDISFHLQRMDAIINEISNGGLSVLPIRIYHSTIDGYGYASPLFYADIFFWPFAILTVLFKLSVITAYKLMLASTIIAAYFTARKSFSWVTDDTNAISIMVFLYISSNIVFGYITGSIVGRGFACIFDPLAICGFYRIVYSDSNNKIFGWIPLSVGVAGTLLSNVIDATIVCFTLIVLFIFCIRKITLEKIGSMAIAAIFCMLITAWFILPMLEQMSEGEFFVTSDYVNHSKNDLSKYTVPLMGLIFPSNILLIICNIFGWIALIPRAYYYCLTFIIMIAIMVIKYRKEVLTDAFYKGAIFLVILFTIFQTKVFPFDFVKNLVGAIQFPFRISIVLTILYCLLTMKMYCSGKIKQTIIVVSVSVVVLFMSIVATYGYGVAIAIYHNIPFAEHNYDSYSIGAAEYLPVELLDEENSITWKDKYIPEYDNECKNQDGVDEIDKDWNLSTINYSGISIGKDIKVPYIYYLGYAAKNDVTGERLKTIKNDSGMVSVITDSSEGQITVWYEGTKLQRMSVRISLISLFALLIAVILNKYMRYRNR